MTQITFQDIKVPNNDDWKDISSEEYRSYHYESGHKETIHKPIALNVNKKSEGHRVIDAYGVSHYIKKGWIKISWKAEPHFVF